MILFNLCKIYDIYDDCYNIISLLLYVRTGRNFLIIKEKRLNILGIETSHFENTSRHLDGNRTVLLIIAIKGIKQINGFPPLWCYCCLICNSLYLLYFSM